MAAAHFNMLTEFDYYTFQVVNNKGTDQTAQAGDLTPLFFIFV